MILVTVMYPTAPGSWFDETYYLERHIPLVKRRWSAMGLEHVLIMRGVGTPEGREAPVGILTLLSFTSLAVFGQAAEAHGAEIFGDIPSFTNVQPQVQINEAIEAAG